MIENWCTTYNFGGDLLRRLNYIKCIHCAIEHLGGEQLPVVGYRSHMALSVKKCYYSDCVVRSVCKHTFLILVVSAVVDIKSVGVCEPVGGFHENWCKDSCGSVAAGVAVPPLLLDDSLVVARVFR